MYQSGIYMICNVYDGRCYIGSAVNIARRLHEHTNELRCGRHKNSYLQRAWNKYGEGCFMTTPLLFCEPEFLLGYEQHFLDTTLRKYNLSPTTGNQLGYKHTDEAKSKISRFNMENKNALGNKSHTGLIVSDETKQKISASLKGIKHSEETRRKNSKSAKLMWQRRKAATIGG